MQSSRDREESNALAEIWFKGLQDKKRSTTFAVLSSWLNILGRIYSLEVPNRSGSEKCRQSF